MADVQLLLREYGTRVDSEWRPVSSAEVFTRAKNGSPSPAHGAAELARELTPPDKHRWTPLRVAVVAAAIAILLFLPLLMFWNPSPIVDDTVPTTVPATTTIPRTTPTMPAQLGMFVDSGSSYEVLLPDSWLSFEGDRSFRLVPGLWNSDDADGNPYPGVRRFGIDGAGHGVPALTISYGEPDGSVFLCQSSATRCAEVVVQSLEELEEVLVSTPLLYAEALCGEDGCEEREPRGDLTLGGEPARFEAAGIRNNGLGMPWAMHHVFAIHEGRPVVLAFDYWIIRFEDFPVDEVVESFRFLDG